MADVICIVDHYGDMYKMRNGDAFNNKALLTTARSIANRYADLSKQLENAKERAAECEKHIADLKKQAIVIGLELEP
jgi:hypothetical protein